MGEQNWKQLEKEIKNCLSVFVTLPELENNKNLILTQTSEVRKSIGNLKILTKTIEMASEHKQFQEENRIIARCASFLWLFEGYYVSSIDLFCFLLITTKHDLFDPIRRQYVHSFEDINNVDLSTKFIFLKEHNFGIFVREQDKKLRNRIAHHDFTIKDGKLVIAGNNIDIRKAWMELCDFTFKGLESFENCLGDYTKE